jgi:hypothetical protein
LRLLAHRGTRQKTRPEWHWPCAASS